MECWKSSKYLREKGKWGENLEQQPQVGENSGHAVIWKANRNRPPGAPLRQAAGLWSSFVVLIVLVVVVVVERAFCPSKK
jgi:hypothetical protein